MASIHAGAQDKYTTRAMYGLRCSNIPRELKVALGDLLEHLHLALGLKGGVAAAHLVRQHTNSPPGMRCEKITGHGEKYDKNEIKDNHVLR